VKTNKRRDTIEKTERVYESKKEDLLDFDDKKSVQQTISVSAEI